MAKQNTHSKSDLIGQRQHRIEKIKKLRELGIDPYPNNGYRSHYNIEVKNQYTELKNKEVSVVGRIMLIRDHGNLMFMQLRDHTADIQLYIKKDELKKELSVNSLDLLDVGDHIQADGIITETKTGEISVLTKDITMLSKAIRPLPVKWGGLEDKDLRYRRRYLDMTLNPDIRKMFERRAQFWDAVRDFMKEHDFIEVNTPILEETTGGADANPFETYFDVMGEKKYLRISQELPLKRLIGGGFEKVFDLGPRFRNEGYSDEHLPEHIAMEWYWAYADYKDGMKLTEEMFKYILKKVYGTSKFTSRGFEVDLDDKWIVYDYADLIKDRFQVDIFDDSLETLKAKVIETVPSATIELNRSRLVDTLWKEIRKTIGGPAFVIGVPKFLSPLSKTSKEDPRKTERFHPLIAGSELANAFSELNDPLDQLDRFTEQQKMREGGDEEAHMMDIDFIEMMEYGMPPTVGYGMAERVFWFFENVTAREGVPFPPMRHGFNNKTKEIYGDIYDFEAAEKEVKRKPFVSEEKKDLKEQDKSKKFVLVIDKLLNGWQLLNTVSHLSAYLGNKVEGNIESTTSFTTTDDIDIPADSQYPIIAKSAKQSQLFGLLDKIRTEDSLKYIVFTKDMITLNDDVELAKTIAGQSLEELSILGIGVFGKNEDIDKVTKKYSLWK